MDNNNKFSKTIAKFWYDARTLSLKTDYILAFLENYGSAVFEVTIYFAFSLP